MDAKPDIGKSPIRSAGQACCCADGNNLLHAGAFQRRADLVLLAMGFVHVVPGPLVRDLGLSLDSRGNLLTDENKMTCRPGVFAAGDAASGASLVVRAIAGGREAAEGIGRYLMK